MGDIYSQDLIKKKPQISPTTNTVNKNNLEKVSVELPNTKLDSVKKDSTKTKKVFLDGKVKYKAKDYTKIDQKKKHIILYDNAELYYQDVELKSGIILLDYEKDEVYAGRIKDITGK